MEVVVGLGQPGQQEVEQEGKGRQVTQVWAQCGGQSLG